MRTIHVDLGDRGILDISRYIKREIEIKKVIINLLHVAKFEFFSFVVIFVDATACEKNIYN